MGEEYQHMLSSYIVQHTQKVAIGPLEYCGNAHHISMGKSTMYVSLLIVTKVPGISVLRASNPNFCHCRCQILHL
jgi:hypothetical protein